MVSANKKPMVLQSFSLQNIAKQTKKLNKFSNEIYSYKILEKVILSLGKDEKTTQKCSIVIKVFKLFVNILDDSLQRSAS